MNRYSFRMAAQLNSSISLRHWNEVLGFIFHFISIHLCLFTTIYLRFIYFPENFPLKKGYDWLCMMCVTVFGHTYILDKLTWSFFPIQIHAQSFMKFIYGIWNLYLRFQLKFLMLVHVYMYVLFDNKYCTTIIMLSVFII